MGENAAWVDEPDADGLGPVAVRAVALKYYRQWRAGQLDPNEPVHAELLLTAEHILNDIRMRAAAVLMPPASVKLALPAMSANAASVIAEVTQASTGASNTGEPELS